MLAIGALFYLVSSAPAPQALAADTTPAIILPVPAAVDTPPPRGRPKVINVDEWYSRRLTIHRYVAYGTIPVFAAQWIAGEQLYQKSTAAPTWAKTTHRAGATALAAMFTVNTVTGVWNWWDSREAPGLLPRTLHAVSMLTSDVLFTYAGVKLSNDAETDRDKRKLHHTIGLSAMGLTVVSGVAMKLINR